MEELLEIASSPGFTGGSAPEVFHIIKDRQVVDSGCELAVNFETGSLCGKSENGVH